jgi:signal transduction histidine kinase
MRKVKTDVDEIVLEAMSAVSVLARQKQIGMQFRECPGAHSEVDPALFQQLLMILLDNAIRYSPSGSNVEVEVKRLASEIEIDVKDEGSGIPAEAREKIFERFYREDQSRSRTVVEGAGLGLSIARWIAGAHGGSVELVDSTANGSLFRVHVPAFAEKNIGIAV